MKKERLGELILACQDSMYHVAKTLLRSDADCADAIGEAIVKAFARLDSLRDDRHAKTWLTRIVINECYNVLRKQSRIVSLEEYPPEDRPDDGRQYTELYDALGRLPEQMRLCVTLYYLEGYSVRETAALLETSENVVKKRLARARQLLKDDLTTEGLICEH
mgnify:CR=1 FL=1